MAGSKKVDDAAIISASPLDGDEEIPCVDDPSGTPESKSLTPDGILAKLASDDIYVLIAGDTMTGNLVLDGTNPFFQLLGTSGNWLIRAAGGAGGVQIVEVGSSNEGLNVTPKDTAQTVVIHGGLVVNQNGVTEGDFRVESDSDENAFFVDAAGGRVSIAFLLNLNKTSSATDPTTTQFPTSGDVGVHHNTATGERFWATNDGGTAYFVELSPFSATYAGMYAVGNTTNTVIALANTPVQATVFDTNGLSAGATPDHTQDHITINTTATYQVRLAIVVNSVGGGGSTFRVLIQINNGATTLPGLQVRGSLSGGGGDFESTAVAGLAALTDGDTVEVWIENQTGTQDYLLEDLNLSVILIS